MWNILKSIFLISLMLLRRFYLFTECKIVDIIGYTSYIKIYAWYSLMEGVYFLHILNWMRLCYIIVMRFISSDLLEYI